MRVLFVMDPLSTLNLAGDSTFMLMKEATARGWTTRWCTPDHLFVVNGEPWATAEAVATHQGGFHPGGWDDERLGDFDLVWMRKDPPFDMHYIFTTYLLDMAPPRTVVLNRPAAIRSLNEKLFAARFTDLTPPTLITKDIARLLAFVEAQPDRAVLKPWDGNGGRGVLVTKGGDPNLRSMIELLTGNGQHFILAQRHVPEITHGDKRIILVDGEPVGAILRVPSARDHRGNIHVGARVEKTELTEREHHICQRIGPTLRDEGLVFVGIDVIGGWLTEINVTSPTGIQEINRLDLVRLDQLVMDAAQRRVELAQG